MHRHDTRRAMLMFVARDSQTLELDLFLSKIIIKVKMNILRQPVLLINIRYSTNS